MKHTSEEVKLENGARGLLINVEEARVMHVMFNFRAGDFLSPKGKWEVAHLLEHMMLGANQKYPKAREFQAELQKNGAYFNAFTNSYDITYIGECADFEWRRIFELFLSAIEFPLLREDEFVAESGNVREELSSDLNMHFRQLIIAAKLAHGMVALPDGQRLAQLKNIAVSDMKKHYDKTHTTGNLRFIIAGNLANRKDNLIARLNNLTLIPGRRKSLPKEEPKNVEGVLYIDRLGVDNLYFVINVLANEALKPKDEDALSMLNTILTSTVHNGILGEAREKGLAYHISSSHSKGRAMTDWSFGAQVLPVNAPPVFDIITSHVKKTIEGKTTKKSLDAAKRYSLGHFKRSIQTVGSLARNYGAGYFYDGRIEDYDHIEPRIKAVTQDKITNIANRMIEEEYWGVGVLASKSDKLAKRLHSKVAVLWQ